MKPEITDIAYSTALTFELVTQYGVMILGAPIFPSLQKEAVYKTDMNTRGVLLFMQYKLSERIVGTASSLKEDWGIPYYRFLIHPKYKNKRHELLLNLEKLTNMVYYIAPGFHTRSELYESLMHKTLLTNSTFWSPKAIGDLPIKTNSTTLSYKRGMHYGILEPGKRKIDGVISGEMLRNVINNRFETNQSEVYGNERFVALGDQMLENYLKVLHTPKEKRLIKDIKQYRDRIDPRDYLSLISILLYDCYVYIVAR
jgi:hypothetical protein